MFTLPLIKGDPETALDAPHSIILTEKLAKKYFGNTDPVGQSLTLENKFQFMVTGVMKELPKNSMFTFEGIISFSFLQEIGAYSDHWGNNSIFTYVMLENGVDIESINKKLTDIVLEYLPETETKYLLFPLNDINLHGQFGFTETKGPVIAVFIFSLIAVFILLIACIGLFGLASWSAERRTNEVGIRKVMGAGNFSIIYSVSKEFLILIIISIAIAFPAGWIIMKKLLAQFPYRIDLDLMIFLLIAAASVAIAMLTVSFQAFRATGINPAEALKIEK